MFQPKFSYTDKMVTLLTKIASSREVILNSPLIPKWEVSLRKEALIHSAHSSTSIEGNPLSLGQVSQLAEGRKIMGSRKDKQEVLNYLYVLEHLESFSKDRKISGSVILRIHKYLTRSTLSDESDCGVYRKKYVVVADRLGQVSFYPPENEKVPSLVEELVEWIHSKDVQKVEAVIVAGIFHYEFVRIHPFVDGNGRTARVLATLILFLRGFDSKRFFSLDDYYDSDRQAYYEALQSVDRTNQDMTRWLEYFVEGVAASLETVKERVIRLSSERLKRTQRGQIALTERQMKIIEFINQNEKIAIGDLTKMFKITRQAALKEISKLVGLKVLKLRGKGRGAYYSLA